MKLKDDIMVITNTYISQLHYIVSRVSDSKEEFFVEEFKDLIALTEKFEENINKRYERGK
mgnify:CR=1 FL=1